MCYGEIRLRGPNVSTILGSVDWWRERGEGEREISSYYFCISTLIPKLEMTICMIFSTCGVGSAHNRVAFLKRVEMCLPAKALDAFITCNVQANAWLADLASKASNKTEGFSHSKVVISKKNHHCSSYVNLKQCLLTHLNWECASVLSTLIYAIRLLHANWSTFHTACWILLH